MVKAVGAEVKLPQLKADVAFPGQMKERVQRFVNLGDQELMYIAQNKTYAEKKNNKSGFMALPVVDSLVAASQSKQVPVLATGILGRRFLSSISEKSLASRRAATNFVKASGSNLFGATASFGLRMASWGAFFGIFNLSSKLFNKITDKSDKLSEIREKNPLVHTVADLGFSYGAYVGLKNGALKAVDAIPETKKLEILRKLNKVQKSVNKSKTSKSIFEPIKNSVSKLAKKYPKIADSMPLIKKYAVPVTLGAVVLKSCIIDPIKTSKDVFNNYAELKMDQQALKAVLDSDSSVNG